MSTKQSILVFLGSFYPYDDAISNVLMPLLKELQKDYQVDIFTRCPEGDQPLRENIDGFQVYRDRRYDQDAEKRKKWFHKSELRDTNLTLTDQRHIVLKRLYVRWLNRRNDAQWFRSLNRQGEWIQSFRQLIRNGNYRAVMTVTSPIQSQIEALKLAEEGWFQAHHIVWIPYYVDPFATFLRNTRNRNFSNFLKFETEVYEKADAVFTSPELYEDNLNYPMGKYHDKTIPVQFAAMKPLKDAPMPSFMHESDINIVYTGSLFDHNIRKPDYFFQIASALPEPFQIYIACNLSNPLTDARKQQYLDGHSNIHWLNRQPISTCFAMMKHADVLINLGNEAPNQTPSKVFDYIGMHRPIASFYSIENDTSLKYLKEYPYLLPIKNKDKLDPDDLHAFMSFARKMKQTSIDDAGIEYKYHAYQASELAMQFRQKFNEVLKKKEEQ